MGNTNEAYSGRELVLKIGNDESPTIFDTIAGCKNASLSLNETEVDTTNKDDAGWRDLLSGSILKSVSISGEFVFGDHLSQHQLITAFNTGTHRNFQVVLPGVTYSNKTFEGAFRIVSIDYQGPHDADIRSNISLASAGAITIT